MSNQPTEQHRALFEQAQQYEAGSDPYNAVKLYKLVAREAPSGSSPIYGWDNCTSTAENGSPRCTTTKELLLLMCPTGRHGGTLDWLQRPSEN